MKKRIGKIIVALFLAILALLMAVSSCTPQSALTEPSAPENTPEAQAAVPTEAPAPAAPAEPQTEEIVAIESDETPTETPVAETDAQEAPPPAAEPASAEAAAPAAQNMADMTPAERAAAWGLPAPPEGVDLGTRAFKLANSYNSITDQRPNHAYGAGVTVDSVSADAFNRFVSDAQAAGYGVTAFRGYVDYWTTLEQYYEPAVNAYGAEIAAATTYVPGCHDHQTALCVDLRLGGSFYNEDGIDFRGTEAWDWLIAHCADYGIILRYPEGQESWYGTPCMNPCHFRYVGVEPAKYIMENNITLEQFMLICDWDSVYVPGIK